MSAPNISTTPTVPLPALRTRHPPNTSTTTTRLSPVQAYDAGAIIGLAVAIAGKSDPSAIKDAIRKVVDPNGTVVHAGKDEFAKALQLIKDGKPIKYEGVIGSISFDGYGDITGPFRLWRIKDGEIATVGTMTTADVNAVKAKIGN